MDNTSELAVQLTVETIKAYMAGRQGAIPTIADVKAWYGECYKLAEAIHTEVAK